MSRARAQPCPAQSSSHGPGGHAPWSSLASLILAMSCLWPCQASCAGPSAGPCCSLAEEVRWQTPQTGDWLSAVRGGLGRRPSCAALRFCTPTTPQSLSCSPHIPPRRGGRWLLPVQGPLFCRPGCRFSPRPLQAPPSGLGLTAGAGPGSRPRARGWGASPRWGVTPAVRALPLCATVVGSQSATGGPGALERACGAGTAPGLRRRRGVGSAG